MKKILLATLIAACAASPTYAEAHGGDGWWALPATLFGAAVLYDATHPHYYGPQTVYVQPQAVYVQPAPVYYPQQPYYQQQYGYVVQTPPPPQASAAPNWYYCTSSNGYYPYVRVCPEGWKEVSATPPDIQGTPSSVPPPPR
jgi:hypothetical protein